MAPEALALVLEQLAQQVRNPTTAFSVYKPPQQLTEDDFDFIVETLTHAKQKCEFDESTKEQLDVVLDKLNNIESTEQQPANKSYPGTNSQTVNIVQAANWLISALGNKQSAHQLIEQLPEPHTGTGGY